MPGIEDSEFPEQVISLPDPEKLEPKVPMAVKRQVFKPEADGNTKLRDQKATLEKNDYADKDIVPLSLFGRDEGVLGNQLWLTGASQIILWGGGNGMFLWVAVNKRIPTLTVFESEVHRKVIMDFLLQKIKKEMGNPTNARFYKSDEELHVTTAVPAPAPEATAAAAKAKAAAAKAKATAKAKAAAEARANAGGSAGGADADESEDESAEEESEGAE